MGRAFEDTEAPNVALPAAGRLGAQLGAVKVAPELTVAFHAETTRGPPVTVTDQGDRALVELLVRVASIVAPPVHESVTRHVSTMSSAAAAGVSASSPDPISAAAEITASELVRARECMLEFAFMADIISGLWSTPSSSLRVPRRVPAVPILQCSCARGEWPRVGSDSSLLTSHR